MIEGGLIVIGGGDRLQFEFNGLEAGSGGFTVADLIDLGRRAGLTDPDYERGVREGWITPATDRSGTPPPRKPIPGYTLEQLLADLDKDREDRW